MKIRALDPRLGSHATSSMRFKTHRLHTREHERVVARVGQGHELVVVVGIDLGGFKVRTDDRATASGTAPGPGLRSFGFGVRQRSLALRVARLRAQWAAAEHPGDNQ